MNKTIMIKAFASAYFEDTFLQPQFIETKYFYKLFNKQEQKGYTSGRLQNYYFGLYKKIYTQIFKDYNLNLEFVDIQDKNGPWDMFTVEGPYDDFKRFYDMGTLFIGEGLCLCETLDDFKKNQEFRIWYK